MSASTGQRDADRLREQRRRGVIGLAFRLGSEVFRTWGRLTAGQRQDPDFLIIGAKRGGTTSLYYDLLKVPQIIPLFPSPDYLPKAAATKGIHFFDSEYARGLRWYRSHMPTRGSRRRAEKRLGRPVIVGEASPYYLFHPLAAERAYAALPDVKVILILRDPVQRTYSHWKERRRSKAEHLDFEDALAAESDRLAGEEERLIADPRYRSYAHEQQSYLAQSHYARALRRWADLYGMQNILVVPSEEYYADQTAVVAQVAEFLGVDPGGIRAGERRNAASGGSLPPDVADRLRAELAPDIAELEQMVGRRLPWG
ncbi:sulfotransferase domain-containing protein [Microbacterium sp. GCS4]|uniref:sulfotransferase domain-containing protein n=1 Tax=Microbacterium sp. GCS4 TaxID=1692239 RepID=UPI0006837E4C|nr:sulfotransferase domain-containing protein [Microbacterium sp. GCS4]